MTTRSQVEAVTDTERARRLLAEAHRAIVPDSVIADLIAGGETRGSIAISSAVRAIEAAYRAGLEDAGWQDIASAPKDGRFVLLFYPRAEPPVSIGYWDDAFGIPKNAGWMMLDMDTMMSACQPSHWRPLPDPPAIRRHVLEGDDG